MSDEALLNSLSVEEAATLLGVSGQTIRRRLKVGQLRGELVLGPTGREWRVFREGALAPLAPIAASADAIREVLAEGRASGTEMTNTLQRLATVLERLTVILEAQQEQHPLLLPSPAIPPKKKGWWRRWVLGSK